MKKIVNLVAISLLIAGSVSACAQDSSSNTNPAGVDGGQSAGATANGQALAQAGKSYPSKEFAQLMAAPNTVVLDVRTAEEFASGHLPGAINLDISDPGAFKAGLAKLDAQRWYGVYCRSGRRSQTALAQLNKANFKAFELAGGINSWQGQIEK